MQSSEPAAPSMAAVRPPTVLLRALLDVTEEFERALGSELTVNPTDLHAMEHLIMSGPLSPSELSRRLGVTSAATTTVVDRLTALGHVRREPHPSDRRGIRVVASEASTARAMGRIMPMIAGVDSVLDDFDEAEQAAITRYLQRVVEQYRDHAAPREGAATGGVVRPPDAGDAPTGALTAPQ
ncbi:MarR family transcriptional regulator [Chryseoglobus sp. 28M-23]|uniref:MarR family winged helix-turn-helix transcriptional regulator n=1 Tax=Chryseoglobus sp. 28M-23 TaxID=2772253 RepID=UPI001CD05E0B|nr:MarR family transcriptional regulator [Chryseoglobus sp. 28M-23]